MRLPVKMLEHDLKTLCWHQQRLPELLSCFASRVQFFSPIDAATVEFPASRLNSNELDEHLNTLAIQADVEAQLLWVRYIEIETCLLSLQPGIVRLKFNDEDMYLGIIKTSGKNLIVFDPHLQEKTIAVTAIADLLKAPLEKPISESIEATLGPLNLKAEKVKKVRAELFRQRLANEVLAGIWSFRPSANADFFTQFRHSGLWKSISALLFSYGGFYLLWLLAWAVIGLGALSGQLDKGWLALWIICLATIIPMYMVFSWQTGRFAIGTGAIIKRKLLAGAMQLDADEVKHQGAGQLLGRVIESSEFERLALSGGVLAIVSLLELTMTAVVLTQGVSSLPLLLLLIVVLAVTALMFYREYQSMTSWTEQRIMLTTDLVENMVGHRTRVAQQAPELWHQQEDQVLNSYMQDSFRMDKTDLLLSALPRTWLVLALAVLSYTFVYLNPETLVLAIALGAVLLCYRSLNSLTSGLRDIAKALIAWKKIEPIFKASKNEFKTSSGIGLLEQNADQKNGALLRAKDLRFQYPLRSLPVIDNCNFDIFSKDKILLEGSSGGGKSTLATLLCGLNKNQSGLMLLNGLDVSSIGIQNWRKKIVLVPQFHENHIFMGPFAFNLLMGRDWPPSYKDIQDATEVCVALGLDNLVTRMPGGMMQLVGDTGWQLSHGEKSRVFIARALLQKPDLLLLDESFAALDPENTTRALNYVIEKTNSLMVIAHP